MLIRSLNLLVSCILLFLGIGFFVVNSFAGSIFVNNRSKFPGVVKYKVYDFKDRVIDEAETELGQYRLLNIGESNEELYLDLDISLFKCSSDEVLEKLHHIEKRRVPANQKYLYIVKNGNVLQRVLKFVPQARKVTKTLSQELLRFLEENYDDKEELQRYYSKSH